MGSKGKEKPSGDISPIQQKMKMNFSKVVSLYQKGSRREYDIFTNQLMDRDIQDDLLIQALRSMKDCIMTLGKEYESLIGVILRIHWVTRGQRLIKEYQSFILNLVSAHTIYLRACVRMVLIHFMPDMKTDTLLKMDEASKLRNDQMFLHVHNLLKAIIKIVPMTPVLLFPLLEELAPHIQQDCYIQECYVKNALLMTQYLPEHRSKILRLIVDRMTKLDVKAPRSDIQKQEGDSDDEADIEDDIFAMDDDGLLAANGTEATDTAAHTTPDITEPMSHEDANRLDVQMNMMFKFIYEVCHKDGKLDWEATKKLYRELLQVFDKIILPTHASAHVQFILFYICSFREELVEGFLDYLWKKVQNPNTPVVFRQVGVAYIASFLTRANYITISTVKAVLDLLLPWLRSYAGHVDLSQTQADITHHGAFYSICQAVFYIFIFRHKQLMAMPKGQAYCETINLQTIVTCRLNPLRFCLAVVAKTFASIARQHQLAFCDTILERNKRAALHMSVNEYSSDANNPLNSFFPFDPYLLSRSGSYIIPLYQEFEGTAVQDEDQEEEEEEEKHYIEDEIEKPSNSMEVDSLPKSYGQGITPTSPTDFLMYGTSPGFKHM